MRTFVVYRTESDHARDVMTFLEDFRRQTHKDVEVIDPDTVHGAELCRLYDIVEYPSIVAVDEDGGMQNLWKGLPLPTISEVSYYTEQE